MKKWTRRCPKCRRLCSTVCYTDPHILCRSCASRKIALKSWTKSRKKKASKRMMGNSYNKGRILTEKWRENISKSLIGNDYAKGNVMSLESRKRISASVKGKRFTKEHKRKIREASVRYLKNCKKTGARYSKKACQYFDKLNKIKGWEGKHAENGGECIVCGYFLDFYDKKRNIVVEYDEPHHYKFGKLRESDIARQKEIIDHLKCSFYRYNEAKDKLKLVDNYH